VSQARGTLPRFPEEAPAKARLRRIGVIDVGSNSVRLVVFDGMARSPAYFYNEKVLCGLGAGLSETGLLNRDGVRRALATLHRFAALAARMDLSGMIAVATAAVRDAEDGPAFCDQVERETGLQLHIASGAEEARLSAKGVLLGWPDADGLVCDMGGSSMELARIGGGAISECVTGPLGPLKLADVASEDKRAKYVRKQIKALVKMVPGPVAQLFLVGGSWRAIARLDMERTGYPLKVVHGYAPDLRRLAETLKWIPGQSAGDLNALTGTSQARLSLVPHAAPVLAELIRRVGPERVVFSGYGLREGLLYRQMPEEMRALDPLIEACLHTEAASARTPGFGTVLYEWLLPLYADRSAADLRLVRAACLLHDVNWRAHPDYRAELCFESVTRANLSGVDHADRVYLGLALLNRYKTAALTGPAERYARLLDDTRATDAVVLGKAMRLGAMLSGASVGILEHATLELTADRVVLGLTGPARDCAGETVDRRLQSLASRLGREGVQELR